MIKTGSLQHLDKHQLLQDFAGLIDHDRRATAVMLAYIAEIDRRKLYFELAFPSMFAFCTKRFHMSEASAAKRIRAGRAADAFPRIFRMIACGELHLSGVHQLAAHLNTRRTWSTGRFSWQRDDSRPRTRSLLPDMTVMRHTLPRGFRINCAPVAAHHWR